MTRSFFFCGIGGSGMSALAAIVARRGFKVSGSDRARDQGQTPEKFQIIESLGVSLYPQDGSGISGDLEAVIVSSAVEDSNPDIAVAKRKGLLIRRRAELLAEIFNDSEVAVSVAGTSGKTTVTGMIAVILEAAGRDPTVINGGIMLNYSQAGDSGLGNARVGGGEIFVAETDESDGSIALYNPTVAVLNNIALDHKSMEELSALFGDYLARARLAIVINGDDPGVAALAGGAAAQHFRISLKDSSADFYADEIMHGQNGIGFMLCHGEERVPVSLAVPGAHNVANALCGIAAAHALGIDFREAACAIEDFRGIRRRLETVGTAGGITVIDDFAHNPDKIAASLRALTAFPGRLVIVFQPHGYGPLKLMGREIAAAFADNLRSDDLVFIPEAFYAGGTVDRSVTSRDLVLWIGARARWFAQREDVLAEITKTLRTGDRVVVMGARDDTLSEFARDILAEA